jgi:hypothetical protein
MRATLPFSLIPSTRSCTTRPLSLPHRAKSPPSFPPRSREDPPAVCLVRYPGAGEDAGALHGPFSASGAGKPKAPHPREGAKEFRFWLGTSTGFAIGSGCSGETDTGEVVFYKVATQSKKKMGRHAEGVKRILDPEAFEDFMHRHGEVLEMREEVADKFRDLNPGGMENLCPEGFLLNPWIVNWLREGGRFDLKKWDTLKYQETVEYYYRFSIMFKLAKKITQKKPSVDELVTTEWLSYLSVPPEYTTRADIAFSANQILYGKYATVLWCNIDYWRGEFTFVGGYHLEEGVPETYWTVGATENLAQQMVEEDLRLLAMAAPEFVFPCEPFRSLRAEELGIPEVPLPGETSRILRKVLPEMGIPGEARFIENWSRHMERKHLRLGIKLRDLPKKRPHSIPEMLMPIRDICMDLREEMFSKWTHATLYMSLDPGITGCSTQQNFWGMSQWWSDPWVAMNANRIFGWPLELYTYTPLPPILNTMLAMPLEMWRRRLSELYFTGPKGILLDPVTKLCSPEERTPLLHDIRRLMFEKGKMYKNFAMPYDEGIPPPSAFLTAIPCPFYKEGNLKDFITNPDNLSKEYWELLESEGGIDKKTGRIPPYSEFPRLKWLFDPNIEWLKAKDFPPLDWSRGQVWPMDLTREKMELMVEEGYDGSGKEVFQYSALADEKMGRKGKTIMLGTMPCKLPTL